MMNSTGHRQNILDPDYKSIGIGCVYAGGFGPYWVQCFGINEVASPAKNPATLPSFSASPFRGVGSLRAISCSSTTITVWSRVSPMRQSWLSSTREAARAYCILDPSIFQWSSEKPSVVTVSAAGVITGKAPGTTNVVAKLGKLVSVSVSVQVEAKWVLGRSPGGKWWFQLDDGSYPYSQWAQIDGDWYYFDRSGYMQTGWLKLGKSWYYLKSSGVMAEAGRKSAALGITSIQGRALWPRAGSRWTERGTTWASPARCSKVGRRSEVPGTT